MAQRKETLKLERLATDTEDQWRSKQFHAVHLYRVRAIAGLPANKDGELSCSSCHAMRDPIDLTTPRTTCAKCHNGQPDPRAGRQVIAADKPNCTSCHVQHVKDKRHWNPGLLSVRTGSGSDRINAQLLNQTTRFDPVATAPGSDTDSLGDVTLYTALRI